MSVSKPECMVSEAPRWLEVLENKRQKPHKLAHEVGAGAPCLVCKEGCKGLNLHFWRKLCTECKCRKEDHEIEDGEDCIQFEILFGAKKVQKTILKYNSQNNSFDWIPPNVSTELAIDYLKLIPQSKLPLSNSDGARYRKQQLEKQVPLHDIDPNVCHNLSAKEAEEFTKYLENLKKYVIGQGKVMKLRVPALFISNHNKHNWCEDNALKMLEHHQDVDKIKVPGQVLFDKCISNGSSDKILDCIQKDLDGIKKGNSSINAFKNKTSKQDKENNNNDIINVQKIYSGHEEEITNALPKKEKFFYSTQSADHAASEKFIKQISPYRNCEPFVYNASLKQTYPLNDIVKMKISSEEVPFNSVQESENFLYSNTNTDLKKKKDEEEEALYNFPLPPITCCQCLEILNSEEVVVYTEHGGQAHLWHPKCFVCHTCEELLVDLIYFFHKEKVYCGRHYADIVKIPRCNACDELIFVKEYTCAEGEAYHIRHFCCFHCDQPLAGKQYIIKDSLPVCLICFQAKFGKKCHSCHLSIGAEEKRVTWKNLDFHVSSECFRCHNCLKSLLGNKFVVKNENTFCSRECVQQGLNI